jgi:hypothetical protein
MEKKICGALNKDELRTPCSNLARKEYNWICVLHINCKPGMEKKFK